MTHYHEINDKKGDLIAVIPFCSHSCHIEWDSRQIPAENDDYDVTAEQNDYSGIS